MAESAMIEEVQEIHESNMNEMYTSDGSVDWKGQRAVKGKSGGWSVGILLLANQGLATLAFFGVGVNLVMFMTKVLHLDNAEAANHVSTWTGTTYMFSLLGAFVSDSYWGRYKTCAVFQIVFVIGLVELSLSSYLLLLKHCVPGDGTANCEPPTDLEIIVFYLSIYQIALGCGAYQPAITTFGADQFEEDDREEGGSKVAFFSYFYMANNLGTLVSNTLLAYLEDKGKWVISFSISTGAAFIALVLFFTGTPRFRHFKPGGNPLTRFCQVIVAALKKWKRVTMSLRGEDLHEVDGKPGANNGGRKILHTPDFKFLDRAAVVTLEDLPPQDQQHPKNKWRLCTVTQVEEVKCILRLIPIWLCTIIYSVTYTQRASVFVEQGATMKNSLSEFRIPPASMSIFEILSVTVFVLLYRLYIIPLLSRLWKSNHKGLTELQRMGIGIVISAMAMVSAGVVELQRLKYSKNDHEASKGSSSLSISWQIPQYVMVGASEVFMYVAQMEFFNNQAPDGLKSFGSALYVASMSAGSYASSFLVTIVVEITGKGDQIGWISKNLDKGHMDRFYFLLAALATIDLFVFMACAKRYRWTLFDGKLGVVNDV
ncbi:protein NRT1/ PTR FAMILY 7.3-like [Phoenix dactylifera]|uniref:Protein NRT1/ PTR FAMILY 7.3-like n=1 Tax=Phoenix dactylifera TaxID=42345 RepID=A0A8B8ZP94_PHODC|nr:protein NRT1/ PTR FAMILY 7.3-like [Phoenix dactylifera]